MDEAGVAERAVRVAERRIAAAQLDDVVRLDAGIAERLALVDDVRAERCRPTSGSRGSAGPSIAVLALSCDSGPSHVNVHVSSLRSPRRSGNTCSRMASANAGGFGAANSVSATGLPVGSSMPVHLTWRTLGSTTDLLGRERAGRHRERRLVGRARTTVGARRRVGIGTERRRRSAAACCPRRSRSRPALDRARPSRSWWAMSSGICVPSGFCRIDGISEVVVVDVDDVRVAVRGGHEREVADHPASATGESRVVRDRIDRRDRHGRRNRIADQLDARPAREGAARWRRRIADRQARQLVDVLHVVEVARIDLRYRTPC